MQSNRSTRRSALNRNRLVATAIATTLAALSFGAAPASADNELRNGFEDQFGRMLAVEAFRFGKLAFFPGYGLDRRSRYTDEVIRYRYEVERDRNRRFRDQGRYWDRRHHRSRFDRQPVVSKKVEIHYHGDRRRPCNQVVHEETHIYRERDRELSRWERKQRRQQRRHERRFH